MLLELINIKKYYPLKKGIWRTTHDYVRAVDDVCLSVAPGENLGLVGESGCGKTTLGRTILKLIPLNAGKIVFDGEDITPFSPGRMRRIRPHLQMVFQDPFSSLDPRFTVKNILMEAMVFSPIRRKMEKLTRIKEILAAVNLPEEVIYRYPHEFSGGERQRIAIARALVMNPKLLILDEAVSSLDVLVQEQIIQLLLDLQKKFPMTYFFISHNMRVVKKMCAKVAVMFKGKVVEFGPAKKIFENPLHPYTKQLLSAAIHYKVEPRGDEREFLKGSGLTDKGSGHWLRE